MSLLESFILSALFILLPQQNSSKTQSQEVGSGSWIKVVDSVRSAVVVIETDKGQGSGFFVKPDGTLVTNYHVIADSSQIFVKLFSGEIYKRAYLLAIDEGKDIAILRVEAADVSTIPMGNSNESKAGEEVILIGAPRGLEQTVSNGLISSVRVIDSGIRVIQTTAAASQGSSGGALINKRGEAIGVLSFSIVNTSSDKVSLG